MTAFVWTVSGYPRSTCGPPPSTIAATGARRSGDRLGSSSSKRREQSPPVVMLSSPEFSDGEESAPAEGSSLEGSSSRPGSSDRFVLTGEFSSFESDAFVSGSSDREWSPPTEQLPDLRSIFERNGSWECRRESKPEPIIVSDSSSSSDESSSDDSSSSDSDTESSTMFPSRYLRPANSCLMVSIPLSLIKHRLKSLPGKVPGGTGLDAKSSKETLPAIGNESVSVAAGFKGLRTPLSLKLKRMSSTNSYAVVSSNVNGIVTAHSFPVSTSSMSITTSSHVSSRTSGQIASSSKPDVSLGSLTASGNDVCLGSVDTSASSCTSGEKVTHVLGSDIKQESDCAVVSQVQGQPCVDPSISCPHISSHSDPLNPGPRLRSRPSVTEDASAASLEPEVVGQASSCSSVRSPVSVKSSLSLTNQDITMVPSRNDPDQLSPIDSRLTVGFSFSRHFSFYPSDLKLQGDELVPVYSLSLKNIETIPDNHPVLSWTVGSTMETTRKRKKLNH